MAGPGAADRIVDELAREPGRALTVTELAHRLNAAGTGDGFEPGLATLEHHGTVVVLRHPPPDPHLDGIDLRVVSLVDDRSPAGLARAHGAAATRWQELLRQLVASHRCC